jgi:spore coat protein CotH
MRTPVLPTTVLACALAVTLLGPRAVAAQSTDELFDDSTLHDIRLWVHTADWAKLKADYLENTYYPADFEWRGLKVRNVGIRSRGLGTRNEFKPGLRVDMNRYASGQRFLGLRSLLLDNNYRDISQLRERISMKLFAKFGLPVPRESHARLYVNGEYVGLYVLTEELGEDFVRRVFKKPDSDQPDKGTLYEYKWIDEWTFGYLGEHLEDYEQRFEARTHENDGLGTLYYPIQGLVRDVNQLPPDRFADEVGRQLDLKRLMVYLGVEAYLVDYDGLVGYKKMANFYLYRPEPEVSSQALFLPWDKDQTFFVANRDVRQGIGENELLRRATDVPELNGIFLTTLEEAARIAEEVPEGGSGPWMESEFLRARDQVRDAVVSDPNRWFGRQDFDDELDRMLEFIHSRPQFVRCQVGNLRHPESSSVCSAPTRPAPH